MASLEFPSAAAVARVVSANPHDPSIEGRLTFFLMHAHVVSSLFVDTHFVSIVRKTNQSTKQVWIANVT